ncbi:MAG: alpha/beta fold hydrolase [Frankiales bacterium]|nr:alpha/beta fold hydrolase [Frankiales bacterium]
MAHAFVLLHSPVVGPSTWRPVAERLLRAGHDCVVPDLRHVAQAGPPYWPAVVSTAADAMGQLDAPGPVVLVAHSNAGLLLPAVAAGSPRPVSGAVLVDAATPADPGPSPAAPVPLLELLRTLADPSGRLPVWTSWWPDEEVAGLLPDPRARATVVADQPRLPLDYYEQRFPVPDSWRTLPTAYLRLSEAYDEDEARARAEGRPVARLTGGHLHAVVDPDAVAAAVVDLATRLTGRG